VETFGEQWEIISKVISSEEELREAVAEGWHKHPAMAIKVANETWRKEMGLTPLPVPPISAGSRIADLEEENRRLVELLEEAKAAQAKLDNEAGAFVTPKESAVSRAGLI
jgi:hypothetical protein